MLFRSILTKKCNLEVGKASKEKPLSYNLKIKDDQLHIIFFFRTSLVMGIKIIY